MGGEFRLAYRSVVVRIKLLPHPFDLGIACDLGGAQFAIVIGVKARKRTARHRALARTHVCFVGSRRRSALVTRVSTPISRGLSGYLPGVPCGRCHAGRQGERRNEQSDKQLGSECVHRRSPMYSRIDVFADWRNCGQPLILRGPCPRGHRAHNETDVGQHWRDGRFIGYDGDDTNARVGWLSQLVCKRLRSGSNPVLHLAQHHR
jgi:hypothetical protein